MSWSSPAEPETLLEPLALDPFGPKVVAIGGGHGLAACLEAVQTFASEICAIVSVADDGGSSGRLSSSIDVPPPGDIRRCLLALSPSPSVWTELFGYRFGGGPDDPADMGPYDVAGHSLGNLILAALHGLTGDFPAAVKQAGELLGALGTVIPASPERVHLAADVDGQRVTGQVAVARSRGRIEKLHLEPEGVSASPTALEAIAAADLIVLGPGSLFTSVLATVAVPGMAQAIDASRARVVFVMNLVTQDGETLGLTGVDHIEACRTFAHMSKTGTVLAHEGPLDVPDGLAAVTVGEADAGALGWDVLTADLADRHGDWPAHDPLALGEALAGI